MLFHSAAVLHLIWLLQLMLISFCWGPQMQELFWRRNICFFSLSEMSQIFLLNNQDSNCLNLSYFIFFFKTHRLFHSMGGSQFPGKTQCCKQINFWSRNCVMKAFIFPSVGQREQRCLPSCQPPGLQHHQEHGTTPSLCIRVESPLCSQDQFFKCCPAPRSQHSSYIQKHDKSHHS